MTDGSFLDWQAQGEALVAASLHVPTLSYRVGPRDAAGLHRCHLVQDGGQARHERLLETSEHLEACQLAAEEFDHGFTGHDPRDPLDESFAPSPGVARFLESARRDPQAAISAMASYFHAVKEAMKQNKDGSFTLSMKVRAGELPVWLANAPMGEELLVGALDRGQGRDDELARELEERAGDAKRKMSAFPQDPVFQQWLADRYDHWGLIAQALREDSLAVEEACIETMKRVSGIGSRRLFSLDRDALERFERLMSEFYRDMSLDFSKARRR